MISSNKKNYTVITSVLLVSLVCVNLFVIGSPYEELFMNINQSIFEPLFVWSISLFVCSIILLFFSQAVFKKWFKTILVWFLPIGLLITFLSDPSLSYVLPNRVGFATLLGGALVLVTLIFALVQKIKYKL